MIKIRQGVPADAASLSELALRSKAHWGYDQAFLDACREELTYRESDFPAIYFGIVEDPMILGFYALDFQTKDRVEMIALFVEPQYIGKGYGKSLLNHAKIQAKVFGAKEIIVQSDPYAEAFYLAMGAKKIGEKASESIPGRMLPLLSISL